MRKLIAALFISLSIFSGAQLISPPEAKACDHYFVPQMIDHKWWMVEYDCDGAIVNMVPFED